MPTSPPVDHRRDHRRKVLKEGQVVLPGHSSAIDVVVRDLTAGGARMELPCAVRLPASFEVVIPGSGLRRTARVSWRGGDVAGVQFLDSPPVVREMKSEGATPAATTKTVATKTQVIAPVADPAPSGNDLADYSAFILSAEHRFGYRADPVYSDRVQVLVDVCLRNASTFAAHQPFLCVPHLGLALQAAPDWQQEEIASVRKLRRFSRADVSVLEPLEFTHCCTICLTLHMTGVGALEYETGHRHGLDDLPDLRLTCKAGAGNFPSNSIPLIVPALEIRDFIMELAVAGKIPSLGEALDGQKPATQEH
jgi:hypothetical protein